jgi:hypothetical protein
VTRAHRVRAIECLEVFGLCLVSTEYSIESRKVCCKQTGGDSVINSTWTLSSNRSIHPLFSLLLVSNKLNFPRSALMLSCKQFIIWGSPFGNDIHEQLFWGGVLGNWWSFLMDGKILTLTPKRSNIRVASGVRPFGHTIQLLNLFCVQPDGKREPKSSLPPKQAVKAIEISIVKLAAL